MKQTKIVATIGPSSESQGTLEDLLRAGMNIMRLNFSHGDFAEHQNRVDTLAKASQATGIPVLTLQDLSGPKIRIGDFSTDTVELVPGAFMTFTTEKIVGDVHKVSINYPRLSQEVKVGDHIFVNDGKQKLVVTENGTSGVICKVEVGGTIKSRRGVNLPDSELSIKSITEKDIVDLEFGLKNHADYIALSFVRHSSDIVELRQILDTRGSKARIIAKIETPQAIRDIDAIIEAADGVMIARGDLAVEVPFEKVPAYQKMMIQKCNERGKLVIVATQMLESMLNNPRPSRSDVSDIYNAVMDGADAVMLSGETANGDYPVEAVAAMRMIAGEAEKTIG